MKGKLDTFKRFAQKCWRLNQEQKQQRIKFEDTWRNSPGLDPKGHRLGGRPKDLDN